MKLKFARALAENIATIAGNVAHVALIDAGTINGESTPPNRPQALAAVVKAKANIAAILCEPGAQPDATDAAPEPDHAETCDDKRDTSDSLTEERLRDLLRRAESFISGFEDDEAQEGIPELLAAIRAEISEPASDGVPELLADLNALHPLDHN